MTWAVCTDPAIGYDLSHYQGISIQWDPAKALGVKWSISKSWHGAIFVSSATPQIETAKTAGILTGRYAWLLPDANLRAQVNAWTSIDWEVGELPLTIDWEEPRTQLRGAELLSKLEWCIESVSDEIGVRPHLYTGAWYWTDFCDDLDSEIAGSCPLWLAAYPRKKATGLRYRDAVAEICTGIMPAVPLPWKSRDLEPIAWQFDGDHGLYLPGDIDVDVNIAAWSRLLERVKAPASFGPAPFQSAANVLGRADRAEQIASENEDSDTIANDPNAPKDAEET
jgi:hypothetical protein